MPMSRPRIIAHRGAWRDSHENTLAAFQAALDEGADAIELDVHVTADGVAVVHHDPVVRVSGAVPGPPPFALATATAAEVAAHRLPGGHSIPTLDQVLALVGTRAEVLVEVKSAPGRENALLACLDRHPDARVAVHAFDHRLPAALRRMRPSIPIGFLSASYPLDVTAQFAAVRPDAFWQHVDLIDGDLVRAVQGAGVRLVAWTVNDPSRLRQLAALGVDALCTDTPAAARQALTGTT
jgi:glycerophosphoryl diester phosphodiesterase